MTVKTVSREAEYKFDQYKRLKLIKRALLLGSGLVFLVIKKAEAKETFQFLWSCYVSRRHDQPFDEIAEHYRFSVLDIADTAALFAYVMAAAYLLYIIISLMWPAEDQDEVRLEYRRREAEKNYRQLAREARLYATSEDILEQNIKLRDQLLPINDELSKLHDRLIKIRLEVAAIDNKQNPKPPKKQPAAEPDLFEAAPCPQKPLARDIAAKWRIPKRRRDTPKF